MRGASEFAEVGPAASAVYRWPPGRAAIRQLPAGLRSDAVHAAPPTRWPSCLWCGPMPGSPSVSIRTCCGTRSQPGCSRLEWTSLSHNSSVAVRFSLVRREQDEVGQLHDQDTPGGGHSSRPEWPRPARALGAVLVDLGSL